jgi:hypothetical protein
MPTRITSTMTLISRSVIGCAVNEILRRSTDCPLPISRSSFVYFAFSKNEYFEDSKPMSGRDLILSTFAPTPRFSIYDRFAVYIFLHFVRETQRQNLQVPRGQM